MSRSFEFHGVAYSDTDNGAREHGMNRGYDHENFIIAYGCVPYDLSVPDRFSDEISASHWLSGFEEGRELYRNEYDAE